MTYGYDGWCTTTVVRYGSIIQWASMCLTKY